MLSLLARLIVPLAAGLLTLVALFAGWWWVLLLSVPIAALGVYDFLQPRWTITRNYPVIGRIRWLFHELRPFLRAYIVEDDLHGTPYSFDARGLVYARARGQTDTQALGTERDTDEPTYHWLSHSMAPAEDPETDPRITVGNDQCTKPYDASVFNISAMSFGSLSANAVEALNLAAKLGGFYHDTGEGGISPYHLKHGGDLVWELGSGYFGARNKDGGFDAGAFRESAALDVVKMTEIKLSQGAKPGHGGMLPGAKVTEEIARIRKIPVGEDCLSPRGHSAFSTPVGLLEFVAQMRELSGGKPVGIKLCVGQPHEVFALMKAILKTGIAPDFIVVDGGEGGTGAAPVEMSDWIGMPLMDGLVLMRNALVGCGLKDRIRLVASGKVYSAMGLAKSMAVGADWCNAARAFMFSIGCIQAQRCHLGNCPTGITSQDKWHQRGLVPEVQGERAARYHRKTLHALADIAASAGLTHPAQLEPHHLLHRVGVEKAAPMDKVYPFLPRGILTEAPSDTIYADWWRAADPDSFKPTEELAVMRSRADGNGQL